jgi:glutamine synthetase
MSVFIGSQLSQILDELEERVKTGKMSADEKSALKLDIGKIPEILLDNTDRNRTSPFAFTGNKFEFRAVGSSANCSWAMCIINTIMADQLIQFKASVDTLIEKGTGKDEAIFQILKDYIVSSKAIRFEGNGYSEEWVKVAASRGLKNLKTTPEALDSLTSEKTIKLFEDHQILSKREVEARHEIYLETYTKRIQIESRVIGDLALNHIIPTAFAYQHKLVENARGMKEIFSEKEFRELGAVQLQTIREISEHISTIRKHVEEMIEERKKANALSHAHDQAFAYCNQVKPHFDIIRYHVDKLELLVDDVQWPLPKYRELLFTR